MHDTFAHATHSAKRLNSRQAKRGARRWVSCIQHLTKLALDMKALLVKFLFDIRCIPLRRTRASRVDIRHALYTTIRVLIVVYNVYQVLVHHIHYRQELGLAAVYAKHEQRYLAYNETSSIERFKCKIYPIEDTFIRRQLQPLNQAFCI